jgi:hypothetical protein
MLWMPLLVIAPLVLLECAARWWLRFKSQYFVLPPGLRLQLHIDRETFPELERVTRLEVNRDGERGSEVPRLKGGQKLYRLLVVGGSQPEGYMLDQDSSWPSALQRLLSEPQGLRRLDADDVHVGNIARSGLGAEALDTVLERILPRYPRLSAIVILVGASDVLRWLEAGAPPAPASPLRTSDIFRCHPEGPFGWTPRATALSELGGRLRRRWAKPVQVHERTGKWVGQARAMRARAKIIRATLPDATPVLDHFERHLRCVVERAKAHADRVVLVRQSWFAKESYTPEEIAHMWHGGVGRAWCEEVTTFYSIEVTSRLMALLDLRAVRVATDLAIEQIDLMSMLRPTLENYYDFFHVTPTGAGVVAAAVASTLLRQPIVDSAISRDLPPCLGFRAS